MKQKNTAQRELLRCIGHCGVITGQDADRHFGNSAINEMKEQNNIIQKSRIVDGKKITVFNLTQKGKSYTRQQLVYNTIYKSNSRQTAHDIALSREYLKLHRTQRHSWINSEQMQLYHPDIIQRDGISFDGYYKEGEKLVPVEVITNAYSPEKIRTIDNALSTYEKSVRTAI